MPSESELAGPLLHLREAWRSRIGAVHGLELLEPIGRGGFATVWKGEPLAAQPGRQGTARLLACSIQHQLLRCLACTSPTPAALLFVLAARWRGSFVSAKIIEHGLSGGVLEAIQREASISCSVSHPNIVSAAGPGAHSAPADADAALQLFLLAAVAVETCS